MDLSGNRPYTFDRVVRIVVAIIIVLSMYFFVRSVSDVLIPFFVAWFIAYMLNPLVVFVNQNIKIHSRLVSIFIVLLVLIVFVAGTVWAMIPSLRNEFTQFIAAADSFFNGRKFVDLIPIELQHYLADNINAKELISNVKLQNISTLSSGVSSVVGTIFHGSFSLIFGVFTFFVTLLYIFFILLDYDKISIGAVGLVPTRYRDRVALIVDDVQVAMSKYFRGQALVALCVGVLLAFGFWLIKLPLGIPLGLFIGLLNMVPYLQIVGMLPMALFSLMKCVETGDNFWLVFGLAILVLGIVQVIQDTFLVPKIMGKITGLNPAIILLSLSIWGSLLGIIGMIIALPLTTILLSYYKRFIIDHEKV